MSQSPVDKLARALLYEGYVLYPYRPSVKTHSRWTFGGVYPPAWSEAQKGTDACTMQTQCLFQTGPDAAVQIKIRFLHLVDRTIGELTPPLDELPATGEPAFRQVQNMSVGDREYRPWQEAVEREVDLGMLDIGVLVAAPVQREFSFPSQRMIEPLRVPGSPIVAILIRRQETVEGVVELSGHLIEENLIRLTVRIQNRTPLSEAKNRTRDDALMRTLVSSHTILESENGKFVSQTDPPAKWKAHIAQCANVGTWPVLVGPPGVATTMLSSPIIIEDHPKIAPESPGDLFDATEIDEILTLRIMTLTEEEKRIAAGIDDRVRDLMARTQSLAQNELMNLHGTLREVDPFPRIEAENIPVKTVFAHGVNLKAGDAVRLRPLGRGDVMDLALDGKAATIVSIEQDFEDRIYVAVTIDDDPGKDLGLRGQPGHRFFFGIEEVEPINSTQAAI
ncbi:MAG TPA: hypothetical protein VFE58_03295 [Tepidisphaeraceae bacterium]|jgi:hypothetical protein|nr:hypothetical protein [Tepidisphaeraceae bacterium]